MKKDIRATTADVSLKSILRVLNDLVLVYEDPMDKYEGDVIIPDTSEYYFKKIPGSGRVAAWGMDCKMKWKVGQRIIFGKNAGNRFEHEGRKVQTLREYDVHCTLEEEVATLD